MGALQAILELLGYLRVAHSTSLIYQALYLPHKSNKYPYKLQSDYLRTHQAHSSCDYPKPFHTFRSICTQPHLLGRSCIAFDIHYIVLECLLVTHLARPCPQRSCVPSYLI